MDLVNIFLTYSSIFCWSVYDTTRGGQYKRVGWAISNFVCVRLPSASVKWHAAVCSSNILWDWIELTFAIVHGHTTPPKLKNM